MTFNLHSIGDLPKYGKCIAFVSVEWSMPERCARSTFQQAKTQIQSEFSSISFVVLSEDDVDVKNWLMDSGIRNSDVSIGCGTVVWLENNIIRQHVDLADHVHERELIGITEKLWPHGDAPQQRIATEPGMAT